MPSVGCDYGSQDAYLAVVNYEKVLHTTKLHLEGDLPEQHRNYFGNLQKAFQIFKEEFNLEPILWIEEAWVSGIHFPQTAIKLAKNAAVIEMAAMESGYDVRRVHISTWRKGVYGNGKPTDPKGTAKAWVLYNLGFETKNHNIAESACIAWYGEKYVK